MELPKISRPGNGSGGGMLDNIKSRLGLSSNEEQDGYDDDYGYDDGYGEYDDGFEDDFDFGEEGFDEGQYNDSYESSRYEPYAPVTTRSAGRSYSSTPRLVTIDDVKANDRLNRSTLPDTRSTTGSRERVVIDNTTPAPSSPASTRPESMTFNLSNAAAGRVGGRGVTVIRPMSYNDVERVARIVRSGDVAVLSLKATPDNLFNRVLDFSFGVASALDAQVDCVGAKVFAIATGTALTESEKESLRGQGVI